MNPKPFTLFIASMLALVAGAVTLPAVASAGTVEIHSCGSAPAGGADNAWEYRTDNAIAYEAGPTTCPPDGSQFGGIVAWTKILSGTAATPFESAELRFTAPAGTTISRVRLRREIGLRSDSYYVYGRTDVGQLPGETCTRHYDDFTCEVGGPAEPEADFSNLNANWIAWGFQCGANGFLSCGTGGTLHQAWAVIYGSTVTLTDNQQPSTPAVSGPLRTAGWKSGSVDATASATDNLGIARIRWYVDGDSVWTSPQRACDYSSTIPCANLASETVSLNTATLADGTREVRLAVLDPAGNQTSSTAFTVNVDNTAPPAPSSLQLTGGGSSASFTASWTNPAPDAGSPWAQAHWSVCPLGAGSCSTGTKAIAGAGAGSFSGTLPSEGTYRIKVWLADEAGNTNPDNAASATITYTPPPPPPSNGGGDNSGGDNSGGGDSGGGGGNSGGGGGGNSGGGASVPNPSSGAPASADPPGATPTLTHPTPPRPTDPAPSQQHPNLEVTSSELRGRTLRLAGTIAPQARGVVTLRLRARLGNRQKTKTARTRIRGGRYQAKVKLPAAWAQAKRITVRVSYSGSSTARPAAVRIRLAR